MLLQRRHVLLLLADGRQRLLHCLMQLLLAGEKVWESLERVSADAASGQGELLQRRRLRLGRWSQEWLQLLVHELGQLR